MSETVNQETPQTDQGMESLSLEQAAGKFLERMEQAEASQDQPQSEPTKENEPVNEAVEATEETAQAGDEVVEEGVDDSVEEGEAQSERTWRIKAEGEEHDVTESELIQNYQLQANVRKKMEKLAHETKEIEQLKSNLQNEKLTLDQLTQTRVDYDAKLQQIADFLNKQEQDFSHLQETDPTQYAIKLGEANQRKAHLAQIEQERARLVREQQAQNQAMFERQKMTERKRLLERIPELQDANARNKAREEMLAYAKSKGVTEQEFGTLIDSRLMEILYDATFAKKVRESKPEIMKKVKKAPKMVKSGVATPSNAELDRIGQIKKQAKKTGNLKDAAKYFEAII